MPRRFITKSEIDDLAEAGIDVLEVGPRDTVTELAREHAQQRGVRIVRVAEGAPPAADDTLTHAKVRSAVRSGVIAALGHVPEGLDAALDKVVPRT